MAVTLPNIQPGMFLTAAQLRAIEAAIPQSPFDLLPTPTGDGQVLRSLGTDGVQWVQPITNSPTFLGAATFCADSLNYIVAHGGAKNQAPSFAVTGTDINVGMAFQTAGGGQFLFRSNNSAVNLSILPASPASGSNYVVLTGVAPNGTGSLMLASSGAAYVCLDKSPTTTDNSENIATTKWANNWLPQYLSVNGYTSSGSVANNDPDFGYDTFTPQLNGCVSGTGTASYYLAGNIMFFQMNVIVATLIPATNGCTITGFPTGLLPINSLGYPINCSIISQGNPADFYFVANATPYGLTIQTRLGTYDASNPYNPILFKNNDPQQSDFVVGGQLFITGVFPVAH